MPFPCFINETKSLLECFRHFRRKEFLLSDCLIDPQLQPFTATHDFFYDFLSNWSRNIILESVVRPAG
jgi:hypothetical protein